MNKAKRYALDLAELAREAAATPELAKKLRALAERIWDDAENAEHAARRNSARLALLGAPGASKVN